MIFKVNVNFYNEDENLNGEERSDTNKSIRRYLGTYDDFILTAFSLQADNNNFIEKSQRERKDLLSQFLDTTVFEQLYHLASEEIKETSGKLKEYKKTDFGSIIIDSKIVNEYPIYQRTLKFKIGFVPQHGGYFHDLTVYENLTAVAEITIDDVSERNQKVNSLISKCNNPMV